jgi:hypothetical protein
MKLFMQKRNREEIKHLFLRQGEKNMDVKKKITCVKEINSRVNEKSSYVKSKYTCVKIENHTCKQKIHM